MTKEKSDNIADTIAEKSSPDNQGFYKSEPTKDVDEAAAEVNRDIAKLKDKAKKDKIKHKI